MIRSHWLTFQVEDASLHQQSFSAWWPLPSAQEIAQFLEVFFLFVKNGWTCLRHGQLLEITEMYSQKKLQDKLLWQHDKDWT